MGWWRSWYGEGRGVRNGERVPVRPPLHGRGRATLDDEAAGRLSSRGGHLQAGFPGELPELRHGPVLAPEQHHLDRQGSGRVIRSDPAEDDDPSAGPSGLGAPPQDRSRLAIGPVVRDLAEQVEVREGGEGVEEALAYGRDAGRHTRLLERLARASHGLREVDERAANGGPRPQDLREHRPRAPPTSTTVPTGPQPPVSG